MLVVIWTAPVRAAECQPDETGIQVIRHRWHTGIVIPVSAVRPPLAFLESVFPEARYLEFGWGDSEFYRNTDNLWLMARALFWPTDTVVHVVGLRRPPAELPHTDLQALPVTPAGMADLQQALAASFHRDDAGKPVIVEPGLYGDSRFYRGTGTFWLGRTCNTWTAQMLAAARKPVRTFAALTAGGVMNQVRDLDSSCVDIGTGVRDGH
jgi:uncharacterized protein (TIGR02117 family)